MKRVSRARRLAGYLGRENLTALAVIAGAGVVTWTVGAVALIVWSRR